MQNLKGKFIEWFGEGAFILLVSRAGENHFYSENHLMSFLEKLEHEYEAGDEVNEWGTILALILFLPFSAFMLWFLLHHHI